MPTPSPIDFSVQRCRELARKILRPYTGSNVANDHLIMQSAKELLPHLAAILAELERLREAERDYLNLLHLEHGERNDG